MSQWYYAKDGSQSGPYSAEDMHLAIRTGELGASDLVWREGLSDWQKIRDVSDLASALPSQQTPAAAPVAQPARQAQLAQPQPAPSQPLQYQQAYSTASQIMFTPKAMDMLRQTKPWARFLAVLGFVLAGLAALVGLILCAFGLEGTAGGRASGPGMMLGLMLGFGYLLFAVFLFFPSLFLNRYASQIKALQATGREDSLEAAMTAQKAFWRLVGIIVLVIICLYVGIFMIGMLGGIGLLF